MLFGRSKSCRILASNNSTCFTNLHIISFRFYTETEPGSTRLGASTNVWDEQSDLFALKGCRQNVDPLFWTPLLDSFLDPLLDPFLDSSFFKFKKINIKINKYIKKRKQTNNKVPYHHSVLHILP